LIDEETRAAVFGAVLRTAVEEGAPVTKDLIVKPGERDFLRIVLTPGQRAIAIPVKTGGASAGLLEPGDQVDVILTQKFSEKDERMARRSVAETVSEDLRVLAIDEPKAPNASVTQQGEFGRTVTLEVSPEQAQKINVATELGKLSLTLRPSGAAPLIAQNRETNPQAVWAGDVSPALGTVRQPEIAPVPEPGIQVMRGDKASQVKLH
jgi:pilus assembly protein CpaB